MQISQKDQQIEQLEGPAAKSNEYHDELVKLRVVVKDLQKEGKTRAAEKEETLKKLRAAEAENAELRSKCDQTERKLEEMEKEQEEKGKPEQLIEALSQEKDLQKLQQYMQILQSKYMAMAAENYLD